MADAIHAWILTPSHQTGPYAGPMFPALNAQRPEFRAPFAPPDGEDEAEDTADFLALERDTAHNYFHRMGLALRVAYGHSPTKGHFANGVLDPHTVARMLTGQVGFAVPLEDALSPLAPFARWLKPDINRHAMRGADWLLTRRLLALLREARHAGGQTLLFLPQEVTDPTIEPHG